MNIQQKMAQTAFTKSNDRAKTDFEKYLSFARGFPSLIHSCGLVQAVTFAESKGAKQKHCADFLEDLQAVLKEGGFNFPNQETVVDHARKADQARYLLLSRRALDAAVWLKRYAEALDKPTPAQ